MHFIREAYAQYAKFYMHLSLDTDYQGVEPGRSCDQSSL